ncbi:MAG: SHOCT domain-containing protein [Oscillospiraceae bacterium]|nr:SHOCT domain-containing protein [Oscillospiraceae bacterium]
MKRVRVKPSRSQSVMGFVVGLIFCCIGAFVVIPTFGVFGIFWTLIAVVITVTNAINAFGKKGVATKEIIIDDDEGTVHSRGVYGYDIEVEDDAKDVSDVKKRIDNLKDLYSAGIISKEEFEQRRNSIIDDATK